MYSHTLYVEKQTLFHKEANTGKNIVLKEIYMCQFWFSGISLKWCQSKNI